jgi:hypothetical protein
MTRRSLLRRLSTAALVTSVTPWHMPTLCAQTPPDLKNTSSSFPPLEKAVYLSGELAVLDPINRRAGLRIDCAIRDEKRASEGPLHYFAMLPCGEVWFHGAPATFQDIPPGTHVHGYFFAPPPGEEGTIAPPPAESTGLIPPENHALLLEDDVSFARRHGFQWKILSIAREASKLRVETAGTPPSHGPSGTLVLDFDVATRVWEKGRAVSLDRLEPGQIVSLNFARGINWTDHEFGVNDVWLDEESLLQFTEQQNKRNIRYHRIRWLPAVVESVEPFDYGGGNVTLALFGGVARELIDDLYRDRNERIAVAVAEPTLRTWRHRGDRVFAKLRDWETAKPRPGFSGVRLHLKFAELLDHFRPGNAVRVKAESWLFISNTPEERIKSPEDRILNRTLRLPGQAGAPAAQNTRP